MPLLFTYGSLQQGQSNHRILQSLNAKFLEYAAITADIVKTGYPFPAITRGSGLVRGELYEVDNDALASLDFFESSPEFYERRSTETTDGRVVFAYFGTGVIGKPCDTKI